MGRIDAARGRGDSAMNTFVKICGLTCIEHARAAADAGADAVGLVFADSPRRIEPAAAAEIVRALPADIWKVGLFVNADAATINRHIEDVGLSHVQLHGEASASLPDELAAPVLKAFRLRNADSITEMHDWLVCATPERLAAVLIDAFSPVAHGGTGKRIDTDLLAEAVECGWLEDIDHLMLAGGLTPENVVDSMALVRPWGVDVSSGVEAAPGIKDPEKILRFIAAARGEG